MTDGRKKGSNFELEIAKIFSKELGVDLRRTPLSGGWGSKQTKGDLVSVTEGIDIRFCVECKFQEGWKLETLFTDNHKWFDHWWNQTTKETPVDKIPLLIFSRAYQPRFIAVPYYFLQPYINDFNKLIYLCSPDQQIIIALLEEFMATCKNAILISK